MTIYNNAKLTFESATNVIQILVYRQILLTVITLSVTFVLGYRDGMNQSLIYR